MPALLSVAPTRFASHLIRAAVESVRHRLSQDGVVTGFEVVLVSYGFRNGLFNVQHPTGMTKGWSVVGQVFTQYEFGYLLLAFASVRAAATLFGSYSWRIVMAILGFTLSLSVRIMVTKANPDSILIPIQDLVAGMNVADFANLCYKEWRREHP